MTVPLFLAGYLERMEHSWDGSTPVDRVRFVVLDSETTGLDPRKDRLISLGAVAVIAQEIHLDDSFEAVIKIAFNTSTVTVHGITMEESQKGMEEPDALQNFLGYLQDGVIVGHHIAHDVECLNVAYQRHFGFQLRNRSLDTMALALHLERDGAFVGREPIREYTLDALCSMFDVIPHDRHTAPGDAFMTAEVFQRLLRLAAKSGRTSLASVLVPFEHV